MVPAQQLGAPQQFGPPHQQVPPHQQAPPHQQGPLQQQGGYKRYQQLGGADIQFQPQQYQQQPWVAGSRGSSPLNMLLENMSLWSQLPTTFSVIQMLDDSGQCLGPSHRRTGCTVSPAPADSRSSTPHADTPLGMYSVKPG